MIFLVKYCFYVKPYMGSLYKTFFDGKIKRIVDIFGGVAFLYTENRIILVF